MRRILSILFAGAVLTACDELPGTDSGQLQKSINVINKKCPRMLDSETRVDKVELKNENTIVYYYSLVNVLAQRVDTHQFNLALFPGILSTIKLSPEMQSLRDAHMNIQYAYADKEGKPVYTFSITAKDYR